VTQWTEANDVLVVSFDFLFSKALSVQMLLQRCNHLSTIYFCMPLPPCSRSAAQLDGYDWFGPVLANNQNHFPAIFPSFGYNSFPGIFKGFLHPSADVQRILDAHRALFQSFYVIGVQLRAKTRLRAEVEEHVWRLMLFLKSQAEAAQRKPVVFYLCIDSKEPWDRLISLFGKDIIFSASITAGRIGRLSKEVREVAFCSIMRASAAAHCERAPPTSRAHILFAGHTVRRG
jgi:hypothetical protein